jgi:hypothetical protein
MQTALGVANPGLDGIADAGGKYNSTDVVDSRYPRRRFVVAGLDANTALIAVERGGIGWNVEVTLYSNAAVKPAAEKTWTLFEVPCNLRDLVGHLSRP